jgi:hypothetical protein
MGSQVGHLKLPCFQNRRANITTSTHHNMFERHHRFVGWLGLAATWVFVVTGNVYDIKTGQWATNAHSFLSAQELWFAVLMTALYDFSICDLSL